jgi:hypothetical protein
LSPAARVPDPVAARLARTALLAFLGLLTAASSPAASGTPVFAEFAAATGEEGVREVRLFVDGQDVTDRATASGFRIAYTLPGDFPSGAHDARVVVVDSLGRAHEKAWTFTVDPAAPEVVAFLTTELLVELDPLPRRLEARRARIGGTTQPEVEVELRVNGLTRARTTSTASGRFSGLVELDAGLNDLEVIASRPWQGEEGPPARARVERFHAASSPPARAPRWIAEVEQGLLREGLPGGGGTAGPSERREPSAEEVGVVFITKPDDGDTVRADRVAVLGRAPAGWIVRVLVDGVGGGTDTANPAGHFTVPQVPLAPGPNELVAEAESPGGDSILRSAAVLVVSEPGRLVVATGSGRIETARDGAWRVEGRAWTGALVEVEVNGRLVAGEPAGLDGRFSIPVPLDRGLNRVIVEASDSAAGRVERSRALTVRDASPRAARSPGAVESPTLLERPEGLGRGRTGRLRPLR